ncbi:MAG TPA: hypothetical protein VM509_01810 [Planctomycetota bacterium]|nr:hypothetical protein [Planctomycetota bacterium]
MTRDKKAFVGLLVIERLSRKMVEPYRCFSRESSARLQQLNDDCHNPDMANNIQQQIEARVQAFVREVSELVRASAVGAVAEALGSSTVGGGSRRGRPAGSKNKSAPAASRGGKRGKRTTEQVDAMASRIFDHVKKNPGANVEGMAKAFGMKSKELTLPISKLMSTKKLKTTGQRRGTKYHVR